EVMQCLAHVQDALDAANIRASIACKQPYTDREEVTCHVRVLHAGSYKVQYRRVSPWTAHGPSIPPASLSGPTHNPGSAIQEIPSTCPTPCLPPMPSSTPAACSARSRS